MARSARRISLVAGITGLALTALPAGGATASQTAASGSSRPSVGDKCLIGTWRADRGLATMLFDGTKVTMHLRGGDVDHVAASGIDHDNWKHSKPAVGRLHGHKLTEQIRGVNRSRLRASHRQGKRSLTVTELGWSKSSSNRFLYRGKHSTGYLASTGTIQVRYRCTATTLTLRSHGKAVATETRVSRKP